MEKQTWLELRRPWTGVRALCIALGLSVSCGKLEREGPQIVSVEPTHFEFGPQQALRINGNNFYVHADVRLSESSVVKIRRTFRVLIDATEVAAADVAPVDSTVLTALAPAGLAVGSHSVTVVTPEGLSDTLNSAFTVLPVGGQPATGGAGGIGGTNGPGGFSTAFGGISNSSGSATQQGGAPAAGGTTTGSGGSASTIGGSMGTLGGSLGAGGAGMSLCGSACSATETCCGTSCVNLSRDIQNCGSCGRTCGASEFCTTATSVSCLLVSLQNVCQNAGVTSVYDGITLDDDASDLIRNALSSGCTPAPTARTVSQTDSTTIQQSTGKALVGPGQLLVLAGGNSVSTPVDYVNAAHIAPIYAMGNELRRSADNSLVTKVSGLSADHDFFVIQVVREPSNGSLLLAVYGYYGLGTTAASWYFANVMMPSISNYTDLWYIYEWKDIINDNKPTNASEFTLVQSGR